MAGIGILSPQLSFRFEFIEHNLNDDIYYNLGWSNGEEKLRKLYVQIETKKWRVVLLNSSLRKWLLAVKSMKLQWECGLRMRLFMGCHRFLRVLSRGDGTVGAAAGGQSCASGDPWSPNRVSHEQSGRAGDGRLSLHSKVRISPLFII